MFGATFRAEVRNAPAEMDEMKPEFFLCGGMRAKPIFEILVGSLPVLPVGLRRRRCSCWAGHPAGKPHAPGHAPDKGGFSRTQIPVHGDHRPAVKLPGKVCPQSLGFRFAAAVIGLHGYSFVLELFTLYTFSSIA